MMFTGEDKLKEIVRQEVQQETRQLKAEIDRLYKIVEKLTELTKK